MLQGLTQLQQIASCDGRSAARFVVVANRHQIAVCKLDEPVSST
ncbi:hypothetical protein BSIN_0525 [Burkholderia singularis]|uniref:Uncharacterized protein n=1 Tax=Burkholderia singularis TaxID=1503053 RepID=A0A238H7K0_9BURK|nr:hypothetical protein BSIN_0525 [Burkholderia singularis]